MIVLVFLVTHCIGVTDCAVEAAGFVFMCVRIFIVIYTEMIQYLWVKFDYLGDCYFVACCYHPPKPSYNPQSLCDQLQSDIDQICSIPFGSVIIVAGDFNLLNTIFLEVDCGLTQLVDMPTHCHNILDRIFCNRRDLYSTTYCL